MECGDLVTALVLCDLSHLLLGIEISGTTAPGHRRPKRWQVTALQRFCLMLLASLASWR